MFFNPNQLTRTLSDDAFLMRGPSSCADHAARQPSKSHEQSALSEAQRSVSGAEGAPKANEVILLSPPPPCSLRHDSAAFSESSARSHRATRFPWATARALRSG